MHILLLPEVALLYSGPVMDFSEVQVSPSFKQVFVFRALLSAQPSVLSPWLMVPSRLIKEAGLWIWTSHSAWFCFLQGDSRSCDLWIYWSLNYLSVVPNGETAYANMQMMSVPYIYLILSMLKKISREHINNVNVSTFQCAPLVIIVVVKTKS